MIYCDTEINRALETEELVIDPIDRELQIQPTSVDLRLSTNFKTIQNNQSIYIGCDKEIEYEDHHIPRDQLFKIPSKSFVLARTVEYIELPGYISAFVEGRSSIGRLGLFCENAGWVDSGFKGTITLELFNASDVDIYVKPGMRICQIVLSKHQASLSPYNGKYQGQHSATGSKLNKDEELSNIKIGGYQWD